MQDYAPPIDDIRFLLTEVLDFEKTMAELGKEDLDAGLAVSILEEAGRFAANRLHPINRSGDKEGAKLVNGEVQTPAGFAKAYREFAEAGWTALSADPEYGGQGLPFTIQLLMDEMISAANLCFGLVPGLTRGATEAIAAHASDELKAAYLPRMISGEWTGVMALTEASAGTDLGLLTTKAVPNGDGSYAITGTKIFISSGDHDFGGNIVHLVLARMADAEPGVKGISLFLCPKYLPDEAGGFNVRNGFSVGALEEKMGLHAQPTCVMNYDGAKAWLIGEAGRGLNAMFVMMNAERLFVGIEGLGLASAAYQQAAGYARDRLQGRSADGKRNPASIIEHADVRLMLLRIRGFVEAARALAGWTALQMDRARHHPDAAERARADAFVMLLTPVVKASFTDMGFESAVLAQQIFGGHGYIREWGMEQYVRDARVTMIYEGTNGVQSMDLVGRKLPMEDGAVAGRYFDLIAADLAEAGKVPAAATIVERMGVALELLRTVTGRLRGADVNTGGAAATDYLRLFALVSMGWMWARMAAAAALSADQGALPDAKVKLADFFATRMLSQSSALAVSITAGPDSVMALADDAF